MTETLQCLKKIHQSQTLAAETNDHVINTEISIHSRHDSCLNDSDHLKRCFQLSCEGSLLLFMYSMCQPVWHSTLHAKKDVTKKQLPLCVNCDCDRKTVTATNFKLHKTH